MAITPNDQPNQFMFTALPFEGIINRAYRDKQLEKQQNMQMAAQMGQFEGKLAGSKHLTADNEMYEGVMSNMRDEMTALVDRHKDGFNSPEAIKDYYATTGKIANSNEVRTMAYNYDQLTKSRAAIHKNDNLDDNAKAIYLQELQGWGSKDEDGNLRTFSAANLPKKFDQGEILGAMEKVPEFQKFLKDPVYMELGETEKLTYLQEKGYTPEYLMNKAGAYIAGLDEVQQLSNFYAARGIDYMPKLQGDMENAAALLSGTEVSKFREISQKGSDSEDGVRNLKHDLIYTEGNKRSYGALDNYKETKYLGLSKDFTNATKRIEHVQSKLNASQLPEDKLYYENALGRARAQKNAMATLKGKVDVKATEGLKTDTDYLSAKNNALQISSTAAPNNKVKGVIDVAMKEIVGEMEADASRYPDKASLTKAVLQRVKSQITDKEFADLNSTSYGYGSSYSGLNTIINSLTDVNDQMLRVENKAFDEISSGLTETSSSRMVSTKLNTKNYELAEADVPKTPNQLSVLNTFASEGNADTVAEMKEALDDGYTFKYNPKSLSMTGVRGEPITGSTAVVTYTGKNGSGDTKTFNVRVPVGENMSKARNIANLKEITEIYGDKYKGREQLAVNVLDEISPQLFRGISSVVKLPGVPDINVTVKELDGNNKYFINGKPTGLNFDDLQDKILAAVMKTK